MSYLRSQPELLRRFRAGERDALAEVYRAYLPRLTKLIRNGFIVAATSARVPGAANADDVADVLQEVFTRAFQRDARNSYEGHRDYWPYLAAIARNLIISRYRRGVRELLASEIGVLREDQVIEAEDCATPWLDPQSLEIARTYVSSLQDPVRAVHAARYVQALSQRDAAKQLGLSRPKLRKLEDRLRRELLGLLTRAGLYPEEKPTSAKPKPDDHRTWTTRPRTS